MNSSHIVLHLARSSHKSVRLHPVSPLGNISPECYLCGSKNVFVLGFIPTKGNSAVVMLCRSPCVHSSSNNGVSWDMDHWSPILEDRKFLTWIVKTPTPVQEKAAIKLQSNGALRMEQLWQTDPHATLSTLHLDAQTNEPKLPITKLTYEGVKEYRKIFSELVAAEAQYDQKRMESNVQHGVTVQWDEHTPVGGDSRQSAWVTLPGLESSGIRLVAGDELLLKYTGSLCPPWEVRVVVQEVLLGSTTNVYVDLVKKPKVPLECTENFTAQFIWVGAPFHRMQVALRMFANSQHPHTAFIKKKIVGLPVREPKLVPPTMNSCMAPNLPELNASQVAAVLNVLRSPLSLIQGPPGTGKTATSATVVYHLTKMYNGPILVCAPSNVAVDQLAENIVQTGLNVVRVAARCRESIFSGVPGIMLHTLIDQTMKTAEMKHAFSRMSIDRSKRGQRNMERITADRISKKILQNADVVCVTCSGAGDARLASLTFQAVLIDEATQSPEPETIIPIVHGCSHLILVGDHKQLGPVVMNPYAANAGMNGSLFNRFVLMGIQPHRLEVQYRMHPCLSEFPSNFFYDGVLQNGVTAQQRQQKHANAPWPDPDQPMIFHQNLGPDEISATGTSYLNRSEAQLVERYVTVLFKNSVDPSKIGVITPYEGQRSYLISYMRMHGSMRRELYDKIEVASVDAFQGREKDYIILSCVRSNTRRDIGFLHDPRRLNVALTRAKYGLVITGNPHCLGKNPLWYCLLEHMKHRSLLVEGPLSNLRPSAVVLTPPKKHATKATTPVADDSELSLCDIATDPVHAPFRYALADIIHGPKLGLHEKNVHAEDISSRPMPQTTHALSLNHSDKILMDADNDFENLDGYKSQASLSDGDDDEPFFPRAR